MDNSVIVISFGVVNIVVLERYINVSSCTCGLTWRQVHILAESSWLAILIDFSKEFTLDSKLYWIAAAFSAVSFSCFTSSSTLYHIFLSMHIHVSVSFSSALATISSNTYNLELCT